MRAPGQTARRAGLRPTATAILGLGLAGSFALVGCSSGPSQPAPTTAPSGVSATPTPTPTPSPTAPTCPNGNYRITDLKGQGAASRLGTGVGGDVTMTFTNGAFTLQSDGKTPIKVQIGPANANLTIAGDITGTYTRVDDSTIRMTVNDANGTAAIRGAFINRKLTMRQLADQIVPLDSRAAVACTGDQATLTLPNLALTLAR